MKFKDFNNILDESWMNSINQKYIENIYLKYLNNKNSVSEFWIEKFKNFDKNFFYKNKNNSKKILNLTKNKNIIYDKLNLKKKNFNLKKEKILKILNFFRNNGHKYSNLNPLYKKNIKYDVNLLNYKFFKFLDKDLYKKIILKKQKNKKFLNIDFFIQWLKKKYCHTIGFEYNHISSKKEKKWITNYIENKWNEKKINFKKKIDILRAIIYSETFEKYINSKYPGYKRFSLEGNDSLIPMLYEILSFSIKKNVSYFYIGMAHRGRLNVLINVLGKSSKKLFEEFDGKNIKSINNGDVKYHLGFNTQIKTKYGEGNLNLSYNPSHLEIINPVIMGISRARIDSLKNFDSNKVLSIMIHGDASFISQGVIQETLNLSQTPGYNVGGSLHIIINNQIGFTTSEINNMRSSYYSTDIAKILESPIFHVNSDDPEACIFSIQMAINYRKKFKKDVFIDLIGYRRNGHNESDDPTVTQPLMYKIIKQHPTVKEIYSNKLIKKKIITLKILNKITLSYKKMLDSESIIFLKYDTLKFKSKINKDFMRLNTNKNFYFKKYSKKKFQKLGKFINKLPKNFNIHPLVKKIYLDRKDMIFLKKKLDWGAAETLAYAYLLKNGISCRISGEDVIRGTFFHRHAVIYDQKNEKIYSPLKKIKNGNFYIWNSALSEEAVLAFEYGYSLKNKNTLIIWEAQFGDFSNVAQVVIDQFISSGKEKWNQNSGIVMFLPHGHEGQGPEHSSARIERYLQLCSKENIRLCIPTTSSQIFHLLCQHVFKKMKCPLIIFSPKSLLRNPMSGSYFNEIYKGKFKKVLYKSNFLKNKIIKKIIFCLGKIYYELLEKKKNKQIKDILLIRIEQLYPFPSNKILNILSKYLKVKKIYWCQEEPSNQGAWIYIKNCFKKILKNNISIKYIGRKESSSSATGSIYIHRHDQSKIITKAFKI
ncbi:MAG: 2-oxoglutarate dehydrogenase E1 component [Buchnera aphidicola (Periphyllus acericola)]|uniref:2-oxoglutarate dehydrogenase E1 component n=1 Tax=Buchnera aphidicola TaxID=9 RepID=UPI0030CBFD38|nr:2-oxoglutarate dehydrogenase E1 component [Buchnera aphidicola (Periphyllus acericola)]